MRVSPRFAISLLSLCYLFSRASSLTAVWICDVTLHVHPLSANETALRCLVCYWRILASIPFKFEDRAPGVQCRRCSTQRQRPLHIPNVLPWPHTHTPSLAPTHT
uniref:Secreted protein n=1 Tax=Gadus morhua TaxID=8049 RepID=A0A8C5ABH9_GADMO